MASPQEIDNSNEKQENKVIVTGFGPFGTHSINASWEAVQILPSTGIEQELGISLITKQIPVSYEDVRMEVPRLWENHKPMLVIHVGVSDLARSLTLEQRAHKADYVKKDVNGCQPQGNQCLADIESSPVKQCLLDLNSVTDTVNSTTTTVKTQLSENAGRYLCEYIYYTSLSIDDSRCVFVHVPPLNQPYSAEELAQGLAAIVRCLIQQLRSRKTNL